MAKIFISYRREDSQYPADRLHAAIAPHVEDAARDIFIDIDNIPLGVNFAAYLDEKVGQCEVLLALIGPRWLNAQDSSGKRRLDDPDDFVRIEIASALKRGIPVVPVLLDGAPVPRAEELPDDLKELALRNGTAIHRQTFEADAVKLVEGLGLTRTEPQPAVPPAPPKQTKRKSRAPLLIGIAAALLIAVIGGFALSQSQFWDAGEGDWAGEPTSDGVGEPTSDGVGEPTDTRLGSGDLYEIVESGEPLPPGIISGEDTDLTDRIDGEVIDADRSGIDAERRGADAFQTNDFATARREFQLACDLGNPIGCTSLGHLYLDGAGVPVDYPRARNLFLKACDASDLAGCDALGWLFDQGLGTAQDLDRASTYYARGCDGEHWVSCYNLASLYASGRIAGVEGRETLRLFERGCDGGIPAACHEAGVRYAAGDGVDANPDRARRLLNDGCYVGYMPACTSLESLGD